MAAEPVAQHLRLELRSGGHLSRPRQVRVSLFGCTEPPRPVRLFSRARGRHVGEEAFLAAIEDSPADEATRLVYADWLEERGDRRGEFLRAAVAAHRSAAGAELFGLCRRLRALRPVVHAAWVRRAYPGLAEDDVREVVFRELVNGEGAGTFLQVEGGRDPSPYFLSQVAGRCPGVQPASAAELREGIYCDRQSGCHGVMVGIDSLRWTSGDRCEVEGSTFAAPLAAGGNVYQVGIADGWWAVVDVSMQWIT